MGRIIKIRKEKPINLSHYNKIKNKICVFRTCGGYGDILMSRMIFEDLKINHPNFHITYAVPEKFFPVVKDHPYIDEIISHEDIDHNEYRETFNITHKCLIYETAENKDCSKNRSDIWANSFGLELKNHNMHLPKMDKNKEYVIDQFRKFGYKDGQKIIAFTPFSAVPTRHIIAEHVKIIENLLKRTNAFCFYLHNAPVLNALDLPSIKGKNLTEAMSYVYFSDLVISTDTGHLHCAGGYNKKILGFFNYTNGEIVGKHYKNLTVVQKTKENDPKWECGPCNDIGRCPYPVIDHTMKCFRELPNEIVESKTIEFLNKFCV